MGYALPPKKRPPHLHGDTFVLLDLDDSTAGRTAFVRRLDEIAAAEADLETASSESPPRRSLDPLPKVFAEKLIVFWGWQLARFARRVDQDQPVRGLPPSPVHARLRLTFLGGSHGPQRKFGPSRDREPKGDIASWLLALEILANCLVESKGRLLRLAIDRPD